MERAAVIGFFCVGHDGVSAVAADCVGHDGVRAVATDCAAKCLEAAFTEGLCDSCLPAYLPTI
eukprot:208467-Chlamydomonas_euryale.AAC.2